MTLAAGLLATTPGVELRAQERGGSGLPPGPGNPLAELQRQIAELAGRMSSIEADWQSLLLTVEGLQRRVTSQGGRLSGLEGEISTLAARVADLETLAQPRYLVVDCSGGQTVAAALAQVADSLGPVTISIRGTCVESVRVARDNVILRGESPGDGLEAPSSSTTLLQLSASRDVRLFDLTLRGGRVGLWVDSGASFQVDRLDVSGAQVGVFVLSHAVGQISRSAIHDNLIEGMNLLFAGYVDIEDSSVSHNLRGISSLGSQLSVGGHTAITDNSEHGVNAMNGTSLHFRDAIIERNGTGIFLNWGSTALLASSRVADNNDGIAVTGAGVAAMTEDVVVENNQLGVRALGSATVQLNSTSAIRGNQGDGVYLEDTATFLHGGGEITGNQGWGIRCAGVPAVFGIHGALSAAVVGSNGLGRINCPGLVVP